MPKKKAKKKPKNARRDDPTPEEKAQRIAEIQAGWTDAVRDSRWKATTTSPVVPGLLISDPDDRHRHGALPEDEDWWDKE